jgi:hypothetical protein
MKIKDFKANLYLTALFIIQPMIWLLFGFAQIANNKKIAYIKFAVLMGMFGFVLFPWGDGFERFKVFVKISEMSSEEFLEYIYLQPDFFFYIVSYIFNLFNLNYQFIQFLFVFLGYLLIFILFSKIAVNIDYKRRFIFFLFVLLLTNFLSLANGLRYELATIFFLYGIYEINKFNKNFLGYLFVFISFTIHFYTLFLFILFYISKKLSSYFSISFLKYLFILSIVIGFFNAYIIQDIAKIIVSSGDGILIRKIASYILGSDGTIVHMVSSVPQLIKHTINLLPMILIIIYLYNTYTKNTRLIKILLVLLSINNLWIYSYSVFLRIEHFLLLFGLFLFIDEYIHSNRKNNLFILVMLIFTLLYSAIQFAYFKRLISKDNINFINETSIKLIYTSPLYISNCVYPSEEIYRGNQEFMLLKHESLQRTMEILSNN